MPHQVTQDFYSDSIMFKLVYPTKSNFHWTSVLRTFVAQIETLIFFALSSVVLIDRDLDQASMEAVVSLLAGLPLQPEEGDGVELMEAKSQLFLK